MLVHKNLMACYITINQSNTRLEKSDWSLPIPFGMLRFDWLFTLWKYWVLIDDNNISVRIGGMRFYKFLHWELNSFPTEILIRFWWRTQRFQTIFIPISTNSAGTELCCVTSIHKRTELWTETSSSWRLSSAEWSDNIDTWHTTHRTPL